MNTSEPISNIDEQIVSILEGFDIGGFLPDRASSLTLDEAKQAIKRLITQEQIKELRNLPRKDSAKFGISNQPYVTKEWLRNRIAELEATLKENNNERD